MPRINIQQIIDPIEVDLWDTVFTMKPITKSLGAKFDDMQKKLEGISDDAQFGDALPVFGEMFDLVLVPEQGKRKKASTVLIEAWDADKLDPRQVTALLDALLKAEEEQRPT